jgi:hypothetical protein
MWAYVTLIDFLKHFNKYSSGFDSPEDETCIKYLSTSSVKVLGVASCVT